MHQAERAGDSNKSNAFMKIWFHMMNFVLAQLRISEQIDTPICTGQDMMNILVYFKGRDDLTDRERYLQEKQA